MSVRRMYRLRQAASMILLLVLSCVLALCSGCTPAEEKQPQYYFTAQVKELTDKTMCVTVFYPGKSGLWEGQILTLSTKTYSKSSLEDVWAGNLVKVVMADPIEDTSQPVVPYSIEREYTQPHICNISAFCHQHLSHIREALY